MTSTYDTLGNLCYILPKHKELNQLFARLFEYTVDEIDKHTPLKWDIWIKNNTLADCGSLLKQIEYFFSAAHTVDHSEKYQGLKNRTHPHTLKEKFR